MATPRLIDIGTYWRKVIEYIKADPDHFQTIKAELPERSRFHDILTDWLQYERSDQYIGMSEAALDNFMAVLAADHSSQVCVFKSWETQYIGTALQEEVAINLITADVDNIIFPVLTSSKHWVMMILSRSTNSFQVYECESEPSGATKACVDQVLTFVNSTTGIAHTRASAPTQPAFKLELQDCGFLQCMAARYFCSDSEGDDEYSALCRIDGKEAEIARRRTMQDYVLACLLSGSSSPKDKPLPADFPAHLIDGLPSHGQSG